jgi:arsenite-transporting ATPase
MAQALYGDKDPTQLFFVGRPQTIEKADGHYVISLNLPFASKENISLLRNNDELVIRVGDYRRNVVLPHILVNLPVEQAKFEGNQLKIHFAEPLPKPSRYRYKSKSKGR